MNSFNNNLHAFCFKLKKKLGKINLLLKNSRIKTTTQVEFIFLPVVGDEIQADQLLLIQCIASLAQ